MSNWSGRVTGYLHKHLKLQPEKWWCVSAILGCVADAREAYASALEQAQTCVSETKVTYEEGTVVVEVALAEQKWAVEHPRIGIFGIPEVDLSHHPERDMRPGRTKQAQAVANFEAAMSGTDAADETLSQILYEQANRPLDPSQTSAYFMKRMGAGIFDGVWGLLSMQYGLVLEGTCDYGRYTLGWIIWDELQAKQNQNRILFEDPLVLHDAVIANSIGLAKKMWDALISTEGWEDDPGVVLGELVLAAIFAALIAGGGSTARAVAALESLPVIGEGMMLRDMGVSLGTLALKGAAYMDFGAGGMAGRLSPHLDDYLHTHGMGDPAGRWKVKCALHSRPVLDSVGDLAPRVPLTKYQTGG